VRPDGEGEAQGFHARQPVGIASAARLRELAEPRRSCANVSGADCSKLSNFTPWPVMSSMARRGRINARELWEQMNTCSCLTLILACIVYWQAREISRVLSQCDPIGNGVDLSLLEHVRPIEWDNVVLYGQYFLDRKLVRRRRRAMRAFLSV